MDYEKKYKEALKDMRVIYPNLRGDAKLAAEHAFPELRESEDERIRKFICSIIDNLEPKDFVGVKKMNVLAWLEKQKEPHYTKRNALFDKCVANCDPEIMKEVSDEIDSQLNKEQKPDDNQFPPLDGLDAIKAQYYDRGFKNGFDEGVDSVKPAEWSEEDDKIRRNLMSLLANMRGDRITEETYQKYYPWLKDLCPSWKPSEEENRLINTSISFLKDFADKGYENAVECIDWLKSKLNGNTCE